MNSVQTTPKADDDLAKLFEYGARHFGPVAAEVFLDQVIARFGDIAAMPTIGRRIGETGGRAIRTSVYRGYVVVYVVTDGGIIITDVLSGRANKTPR